MKRWYVIQVYAGYEDQVKLDLSKQIAQKGLQDYFGEILVPSVKVKEFLSEEEKDQRMFPGYVLVEFEPTPESMRLVATLPRVLKFLGGKDPMPLSQKEVDRIVSSMKGEVVVSSNKIEFESGSEVDIIAGPFAGFVGIVDKIDMDAEKLTVMVSIFGRLTPVELSFDQVKR